MSDKVVRFKEGKGMKTSPDYQALTEMVKKWEMWTGMEGEGIEEAMRDLTGDLYKEIRKFQAIICSFIDRDIEELKGQTVNINGEDMALDKYITNNIKVKLAEMWRDIIEHQKVGVDKICIVTRKYIDDSKK